MTFPLSNLPERSVPWGREVEAELERRRLVEDALRNEVNSLNSTVGTLSDQVTNLQNQIRTICGLAGYAYPPAAAPPPPPVAPVDPDAADAPVAVVRKTIQIGAEWSATWYQTFKRTSVGGAYDDKNSLYQRGSGYTYSMWRFNLGEALGKKIVGVNMYLSNVDTYNGGNFTVFLGTHNNVTEPGARPAGGRVNPFEAGWTEREAKNINIPPLFWTGLSNGTIQGFTMGDLTRETANFARFNGVGRSGAPVLNVTFEV